MKTKTAAGHIAREVVLSSVIFLGVLILLPSAHAATVSYDDFEDEDTSGWLETAIGSTGSTGVEPHNESLKAFVKHSRSGSHTLSQDFSYLPSENLSFDMQAVALKGSRDAHSGAGVTVAFLNAFNIELGSVKFAHATNPGSDINLVDTLQHNYAAPIADWAALAGLSAADPISKVSLSFWAWGQSATLRNSSASVWFDNVTIGVVVVAATLSPELNLHIPKIQYDSPSGTVNYWADLEYVGERNGDLLWKLSDYGQQ